MVFLFPAFGISAFADYLVTDPHAAERTITAGEEITVGYWIARSIFD